MRRRRRTVLFLIILIIALVVVVRAWKKRGTSTTAPVATSDTATSDLSQSILIDPPVKVLRRGGTRTPSVEATPAEPGESDLTPTGRTYQEYFRKDIFMGDSIMDELPYYHYIYAQSAVTQIGLNLETALDHVDEVVRRQPERIFMLFGMNEANGSWEVERYENAYKSLISKIRKDLPEAKFYLFSTLPVDESQTANDPNRKNLNNETIRAFNEATERIAQSDEGVEYIDLYEIENLTSYHEPDGVHFQSPFGDKWLELVTKKLGGAE